MDLLIRNGNVAVMDGPPGPRSADQASVSVRKGWTLGIEGGRIAWVGPDEECDATAKTVDASGRLVTPGYVDSHTHLVYGGDRAFEIAMKLAGKDYLEILAAGGGIAHTSRLTKEATVERLVAQATPRLHRMRSNGTTTLESKSGYALEEAGELRMLEASKALEQEGLRMAHTFLGAHAVPEGLTPDQAADAVLDMLPAVAAQGIASFCDVFVEKDVFTIEHGRTIFDAAKRHGLRPRLHADEIVNTSGAQLAAEAGCISADHLLRVDEAGIQAMADAGTIATLLPTVPVTLMRPEWAPGKQLLEAGVPVALATDHNPNNPVTDMGLVAQLGCFVMGLTPEQALTATTWNGAQALGMDDVGHLQVGARADVLVHDVADLDHWIYELGRNSAQSVVSGGRLID